MASAAATAGLFLRLLPDSQPTSWAASELAPLSQPDPSYAPAPNTDPTAYAVSYSKFNPTPGTGRTGFLRVAPNNYPFYSEDEKYAAVVQPDGGQLSEWQPMYAPSREQAEADRAKAYEEGVPHGYAAPGSRLAEVASMELWVVSELHEDSEYGAEVDPATGRHSGGPFRVRVNPKMRVEELRNVIRDASGILPALQKLSYAGKHLDDSQRTLEHYGFAYWHKRFPHWAIKIRKF
ncbi:hypothetical protein GPECTOR_33g653 [Gonium pectorale]|uniref:Ubiquitin-like domain-containing protein n=1 Tax=Gonium pectorale TaxID=33097 RepID=A0A150GD38_GONPE|nr:hypothetical protein GPECTOR_33g653 [Gonium pectorale]|eukprot:KXZ47771.1 hypothetical protein GPECTOR_33g653 [Gonium pectorale]